MKDNPSCPFLETQKFQTVFFTAGSPNRTAVKQYRFNNRAVAYFALITFQVGTYATIESNAFRQLFA